MKTHADKTLVNAMGECEPERRCYYGHQRTAQRREHTKRIAAPNDLFGDGNNNVSKGERQDRAAADVLAWAGAALGQQTVQAVTRRCTCDDAKRSRRRQRRE